MTSQHLHTFQRVSVPYLKWNRMKPLTKWPFVKFSRVKTKPESCLGTTCRAWCMLLWSNCDLDFGCIRTDVSNDMSTRGEQLCWFIFMGRSKLTFNKTLTWGLHEQIFQMAHLHVMEDNVVKLLWNLFTIVEVMVWTNSDGLTYALTQAHIPNCHCDNYVLLTASRLNREVKQTAL